MMPRRAWLAAGAVITIVAAAAAVRHLHAGPQSHLHGVNISHSVRDDRPQPVTVDIQGADEWKRAPQMHAFYDETVATFAHGTVIDVDAYEARSLTIFREFARAHGANEQAMIEHLKLIPRQVVGIVKEDATVLEDFDSFWAALAGPD